MEIAIGLAATAFVRVVIGAATRVSPEFPSTVKAAADNTAKLVPSAFATSLLGKMTRAVLFDASTGEIANSDGLLTAFLTIAWLELDVDTASLVPAVVARSLLGKMTSGVVSDALTA